MLFDYDRFNLLVKDKGITKRHIATQLNRHQTIFYDWANGKSSPSEDALNVVAQCLDCTVSYLMGQSNSPNVEFIPADPDKVRAHEEEQEQILRERRARLQQILKEPPPEGEKALGEKYMDLARRIKKLPKENQARVLDYLELLEQQDTP